MASVSTDRRQGINSSQSIKVACVAASTGNLTLEAEQTVDGIALVDGDRVFAKDQTDTTEIGIYIVSTGTWTRAPDWDGTIDVAEGTIIPVSRGTANSDTYWKITNTGTITVGTTAITLQATTVLSSAILNDGSVKMIADFSPNTTDTYDLGTAALKWEDLHLNGAATVNGSVHLDNGILFLDKGADVASAGALTLGSDGNYFDITGTTTITSIATKGIGTIVHLHFDGALTLTHDATDLVLPGAADITTAAGDEATFIEYATGDWRCINYQRAAVAPRDHVSAVVVNDAAMSGTAMGATSIPSWATQIEVYVHDLSTDGTSNLILQIGDSGGYEATGYDSAAFEVVAGTTQGLTTGANLHYGMAATGSVQGRWVLNRSSSSSNRWYLNGTCADSNGPVIYVSNSDKSLTGALDRVQVTMSNGTDEFDAGRIGFRYS